MSAAALPRVQNFGTMLLGIDTRALFVLRALLAAVMMLDLFERSARSRSCRVLVASQRNRCSPTAQSRST